MKKQIVEDVLIVGAGPAGVMAAIRSKEFNCRVVLIERNESLGKKLLLTGGGRCNITNEASLDVFIDRFGKEGLFLRTAFSKFFNRDLVEFFNAKGVQFKTEDKGKVFPVTDKVESVVCVLEQVLRDSYVKTVYNRRVTGVEKTEGIFRVELDNREIIAAKKVILATGGISYKATGSTGDGLRIAEKLGHTITSLTPGLVPFKIKESWVKQLQGVTLKDVRISFVWGKKIISSDIGDIVFTHFGVSGPLVLDLSFKVLSLWDRAMPLCLLIDFLPDLTYHRLESILLAEFKGNKQLKTVLRNFMPQRLIDVFSIGFNVNSEKTVSQISRKQRRLWVELLKAVPLSVTGALAVDEAMVTAGGVLTKEINPWTMESKLVPCLYFAGEIIDGCAGSGGFNLQQAFSTGFLAGEGNA